MGAFFMIRKGAEVQHPSRLIKNLQRQLELQGFRNAMHVSCPCVELFLYPKQVAPLDNIVRFENGDFCACVGTLLYEGRMGAEALELVYRRIKGRRFRRRDAYGNYCLIARADGVVTLRVDKLGIYKTYRNRDRSIWSSSFLALLSCMKSPKVDVQAAYEYVFQGATYGNTTVMQGIELVDPRDSSSVDEGSANVIRPSIPILSMPTQLRGAVEVESHLGLLRAQYRSIASCFGNRIDTALSGGYDSRLTLALLMEQGIRPRVHVYGASFDPDVRVARSIDESLHLDLIHIDKSSWPTPTANEFPEVLDLNYYAFDGYPTDGVFLDGADLQTRKARFEGGFLALNGGGGEIFRNFFYLPARDLPIRQFLWSFYSRFDPRVCTGAFSEGVYFLNFEKKIRETLSTDSEKLTRQQIELLYPIFRCRFWMGKNNAINNRFGPALTPFIEFATVEAAASIPLAEKNFGSFEARMIRSVSPQLAGYASSYGHDFGQPIKLGQRLKERLVHARPPILRKYLYRLKKRAQPYDAPPLLSDKYLERTIGIDFPYMRRLLHVKKVNDLEQLNRICTLELLFQRSNPELEPQIEAETDSSDSV